MGMLEDVRMRKKRFRYAVWIKYPHHFHYEFVIVRRSK